MGTKAAPKRGVPFLSPTYTVFLGEELKWSCALHLESITWKCYQISWGTRTQIVSWHVQCIKVLTPEKILRVWHFAGKIGSGTCSCFIHWGDWSVWHAMVGSLCWNCWWLAMASKVWVFRAFIFECNKASQRCRGSTGVPWNLSLMCGRATWSAFRAGWHKASYLEKYVSTTVAILKTKSIPSSSTCPGWKPAGTAVSFRPVPLFSFGISKELPWIYDCSAVSTWARDKHWHPFRTAHCEIPGLVLYKWSTSTCSALDQGNDQLGQHYSLPDWRLAQRGPIHIPFVVGGVQVLEWGLVWWWPTLSWWISGCGSKQIHQDSLYLRSLALQ